MRDESVEDLIARLETERFAAVVAGDFDTFASYCHPELVYTHSNAVVDSLESYLEKCRNGFYDYLSVDHPVHRISIVGDVAIVVGEMNAELLVDGVPKRLANASLAVWVNGAEGWRLLAFQPTVKPG